MRRFKDYDPFAWLYSNYWGDEFHREAVPALDRLLLNRLPRRAEILDLCCGDGRFSRTLAQRGFRVTGLDGSEHMLSLAKQRAPKVDFHLGDARRFKFAPRFEAVISTFDSLNHVMETADLDKVFQNVFACLKPGGQFAFDLNREEAYKEFWSRPSMIVDKRVVSVARGRYDSQSGIAVCDVTLVRLVDGQWQRSDFRLSQRLHPVDQVLNSLVRVGFKAERFDARSDLGMQGDIGAGRDFFLATK